MVSNSGTALKTTVSTDQSVTVTSDQWATQETELGRQLREVVVREVERRQARNLVATPPRPSCDLRSDGLCHERPVRSVLSTRLRCTLLLVVSCY